MNSNIRVYLLLAILLSVLAIVLAGGIIFFRRFTGLRSWPSSLLGLLALGLAAASVPYTDMNSFQSDFPKSLGRLIAGIFLPLLAVPLAVRLYRKWIGGDLTEAERRPDMDGVRAWLGAGNIICAVVVPVCALLRFDLPLGQGVTFVLGLLLLLVAYPVLNWACHSPAPETAGPGEDLSNEREKVLQLLEAGKINAEESAELLSALGQSVPSRSRPAAAEMLIGQRLVILGAGVLLLGFFLPWFSINPRSLVNEMVSHFQPNSGPILSGTFQGADISYSIPAADVEHGLGWWILICGVAVAVLPFLATTLSRETQKRVGWVALGIGTVLLGYLLSNMYRSVSFGIILAVAGYALEVFGTLKDRRS
jgi:hypothetical protein